MALPVRRITTRGIIINDKGEVFAQRLKGEDGGKPYVCTPGGGLEQGEDLLDGLRREMIEETGIAPEIGPLLFIQQFVDTDRDGLEFLEFFYHVTNWRDYESIDLGSTSHGDIEVHECGFVNPAGSVLLPKFLQEIDLPTFIAAKQPAQIYSYLSATL